MICDCVTAVCRHVTLCDMSLWHQGLKAELDVVVGMSMHMTRQ